MTLAASRESGLASECTQVCRWDIEEDRWRSSGSSFAFDARCFVEEAGRGPPMTGSERNSSVWYVFHPRKDYNLSLDTPDFEVASHVFIRKLT